MIKAWLFGVGILFVLAELGIWLKQFVLPLPIYILGGAFLAIASNYERGIMTLFRQSQITPPYNDGRMRRTESPLRCDRWSDVVNAAPITVEDLGVSTSNPPAIETGLSDRALALPEQKSSKRAIDSSEI